MKKQPEKKVKPFGLRFLEVVRAGKNDLTTLALTMSTNGKHYDQV